MPASMAKAETNLPVSVLGIMSPYPVVLMVTMPNHKASKKESMCSENHKVKLMTMTKSKNIDSTRIEGMRSMRLHVCMLLRRKNSTSLYIVFSLSNLLLFDVGGKCPLTPPLG